MVTEIICLHLSGTSVVNKYMLSLPQEAELKKIIEEEQLKQLNQSIT
jgi:hypothetical protein